MIEVATGVVRTSFNTCDFELARTVLVDAYGDHVPVLRGERGSFALSKSTVQAEGLGLDTLFYDGLVENDFVPRDDMLIVGLMREGRLSYEDGSQEHTLARDELYWFRTISSYWGRPCAAAAQGLAAARSAPRESCPADAAQ